MDILASVHYTGRRKKSLFCLRYLSFFLLFSVITYTGMAQDDDRGITGRVFDGELKEWITGAGVRLLTPKDSTLVKGVMTDRKGAFRIQNVKPGKYILSVSFLGFETEYRSVTMKERDHHDLGTIKLLPSSTHLGEVQVVGKATPMLLKKDTVQFSADAFKVREGANVEDLLRRIPGIEIDENGGIKYNGEAITRLEVDGRNFFSSTPTMATKNLPSNIVKNVQVVDKKSEQTRLTGMDDGQKKKVLNLQLKEDKKEGFIANTNLGYGTKERYKVDLTGIYFNDTGRYTLLGNLNNVDGVMDGRGDRTAKNIGLNMDNKFGEHLNVTAEVAYNDDEMNTVEQTNTENILKNGDRNYETNQSTDVSDHRGVNLHSRIEWKPSKQTTFYMEPSLGLDMNKSLSGSVYETQDITGAVINKGTSEKEKQTKSMNGGALLHGSHTFNDEGRNLYGHLSVNYSDSDGDGLSTSVTDFVARGGQERIDQQTKTDNRGLMYDAGLSYLEPFSAAWALQLNYNFSYNHRSNQQLAYNKGDSGAYDEPDTRYSRSSENTGVDHRFGGKMRYKFGKRSLVYLEFDINPGTTHTITNDGVVETFNKSRTVWNYAPSFTLDLNPSDSVRINLYYNGRTRYPDMTQLNPVVKINSPLSRVQGNPDLVPSFMHLLSVHASFNSRSTRRGVQVFGRGSITNNAVVAKRTTDPDTGANMTTYENVDGIWQTWYGLTFNTPLGGPKSKWSYYLFGNLSYNKYKGYVNGDLNTSDNVSPTIAQRFMWNGDNLQVSLVLRGKMTNIKNSISTDLNRTTYDYSVFNELVWNLPYNLSLTNRLAYQNAYGYDDHIRRELMMWDMTLGWSFLRGNAATLELSGYDLLGQRNNLTRRITANAITDTQVNGTTSYVMLTFSYRFNSMGGGQESGSGERRSGFLPGRRHIRRSSGRS